ncbi:hypothetical protein [Castellaniella defragrans]|uniref:hypothetical protein n=1 Tax=Castellaniella defragrans TaxID=75697 RepID=UPI0011DD41F9|nr:hypothetical protein [Castellaniella defragrans]
MKRMERRFYVGPHPPPTADPAAGRIGLRHERFIHADCGQFHGKVPEDPIYSFQIKWMDAMAGK